MAPYMEDMLDVEDMEYSTLVATMDDLERRLHNTLRECARRDNTTISLTLIGHPDDTVELSRLRQITRHKMSTNHE